MRDILFDFPNQFAAGYSLVDQLQLPRIKAGKIVVLGMGGSAIPGDFLGLYLQKELPISVSRDYHYPFPIEPDTLVCAISYSGTTAETIAAVRELLPQTRNILLITAGGTLAKIAAEENLPLVQLPSEGIPQRCATGYFFSILVAVLEKLGLISGKRDEILSMAQKLSSWIDHKYIEKLAHQMKGKVPIIYACDDLAPVVRNVKIKLNENAKTQAFWNVFPELNHNEMVGFTNLVMQPFFLLFRKWNDRLENVRRMEVFTAMMQEKGLPVEQIFLKGNTVLETMFEASYFGDWLSYYLALAYGIDPEPVEMVQEFKRRLTA